MSATTKLIVFYFDSTALSRAHVVVGDDVTHTVASARDVNEAQLFTVFGENCLRN